MHGEGFFLNAGNGNRLLIALQSVLVSSSVNKLTNTKTIKIALREVKIAG